jgi:hypothetical protein
VIDMAKDKQTKNLAQEQMAVGSTKFEHRSVEEHISRIINLPSGYGKNRIVAMVRDPWWIFVYWEITPEKERIIKDEIEKRGKRFEKSVLRIYDVTGVSNFDGKNANSYFDIVLRDMAQNWYVDVGSPNKNWCIEIGALTQDGMFFPLARSNFIKTPRFGMSDILDAEWMLTEDEYYWLFGVSGGFGVGKSSLEMRELFKKLIEQWISSGAIFSLSSHILQQKK